MVYDLAHNIGKIEKHKIQGENFRVCVHRKGATRAFGPGNPEIPDKYRQIGQPVLIPGSMGTSSWVMTGTEAGMEKSFGSCCHGAGRVMSRTQAKKSIRGEALLKQLKGEGIFVKAGSMSGLAEEAPDAYKDIDLVIESATGAGLAKKVAKLRPVVVIKG
jgi:tRNA-splicing ligase RtcB